MFVYVLVDAAVCGASPAHAQAAEPNDFNMHC